MAGLLIWAALGGGAVGLLWWGLTWLQDGPRLPVALWVRPSLWVLGITSAGATTGAFATSGPLGAGLVALLGGVAAGLVLLVSHWLAARTAA